MRISIETSKGNVKIAGVAFPFFCVPQNGFSEHLDSVAQALLLHERSFQGKDPTPSMSLKSSTSMHRIFQENRCNSAAK